MYSPQVSRAREYSLFVPNNDSDKEFERQNRLTTKVARPHRLPDEFEDRTLHYLWPINNVNDSSALKHAELLRDEARHLLALGWGIDQAVATGQILTEAKAHTLKREGVTWRPLIGQHPTADARRVPIDGTLGDLETVYESFVKSVNGRHYTPPLKPTVFDRVRYIPPNFVPARPYAVFDLRHDDGSFCRYSQRKLMHIVGMVRHLAKEAMLQSPPPDVDDDWVERYVVGHRDRDADSHRQFSYLPLPSIRAPHEPVDQSVRRVIIAAPVGDDAWLEHLAHRLAGKQLKPENGNEFGEHGPPTLVRLRRSRPLSRREERDVVGRYTVAANRWASVTPVILPGHDDRKPNKTRKLIEAALAQSGIDYPCEFEWSAHSMFRKSFSAHKYDKNRKPVGYVRPDHLLTQTAAHLRVRFRDDLCVAGPLVIGAGRHFGFGLMAGVSK